MEPCPRLGMLATHDPIKLHLSTVTPPANGVIDLRDRKQRGRRDSFTAQLLDDAGGTIEEHDLLTQVIGVLTTREQGTHDTPPARRFARKSALSRIFPVLLHGWSVLRRCAQSAAAIRLPSVW